MRPSHVTTYETGRVPRRGKAPLTELAAEFLAIQKPLVSTQGYTSLAGQVRRVLAWFEAEDLDPLEISISEAVAYQGWLGDQVLSTGTVHNYLKAARRLFDWLVTTERRRDNPFRELRYPRLPVHLTGNVLTEAQMGRLLSELGKWDELPVWYERERRYRVHVIAELLYSTGLRIAEACSLTAGNLDLAGRKVWLPAGKGGRPRTAFLTAYAADVLGQYLKAGRPAILHGHPRGKKDTLFGAGKSRVAEVVNQELEAVCTALELPVITSHGFRHSLGTHLLRSGCDMRHIQVILGHEALATTQIYTRVDKDDLKRSLDAFHPRQFAKRDCHEV